MGLFDKIFSKNKGTDNSNEMKSQEKIEQERIQKEIEPKRIQNEMILEYGHSMPIENTDYISYIYDIKQTGQVKHRGGRNCDVYVARALVYKNGNTISLDLGDYICFEVKENGKIDINIIDYIASCYYNEKNQSTAYNGRYYLGEIEENNDLSSQNNKYVRGIKSDLVNSRFNEYMDEKDEMERVARFEKKQRREKEEFIESLRREAEIKEKVKKINREKNARRQKRVDNPYLRLINKERANNGKIVEEYDGINISQNENRGDILRIRGLENIGKDGSGTYLYSGYIGNTPNEDDFEFFDYSRMQPVCFEIYRRLEDIAQDGNPEEIMEVLKFLSEPSNFKNSNGLNYIRHLAQDIRINQYGEIERKTNIIRGETSDSPAIAQQISALQKKYDMLHNKTQVEGR